MKSEIDLKHENSIDSVDKSGAYSNSPVGRSIRDDRKINNRDIPFSEAMKSYNDPNKERSEVRRYIEVSKDNALLKPAFETLEPKRASPLRNDFIISKAQDYN